MDTVWMKHFETSEVREVPMDDKIHQLMITGWSQCPAPETTSAAPAEKED